MNAAGYLIVGVVAVLSAIVLVCQVVADVRRERRGDRS